MNWMFYESSGMLLPAQEQSLHPMGPSHKESKAAWLLSLSCQVYNLSLHSAA